MKKTYQKDSDIYLRFAENEDKIDLLNWRNELETRKASFNTEKIDKKDHERWFNNSIKNKKRKICIICDKNRQNRFTGKTPFPGTYGRDHGP